MKYFKSRLFISIFAVLLTLGSALAAPAQAHAEESDNMDRWMSVCQKMADNIEKKHFVYGNGGIKKTYSSAVRSRRRSNCALYVSWCLQEYGALKSGQTFYYTGSIHKNFSHWSSKVKVIRVNKRASRVNLQKGDIVLWRGMRHVNIYAGKSSSGKRLWYDCGKGSTYSHHSGSRFKNIGKKSLGYLNSKRVGYIIRIKNL